MKSYQILVICFSFSIVNAQSGYGEQYWRRSQLQYGDELEFQQRDLSDASGDSWDSDDYLVSRDVDSLDDLEIEIRDLLRRQGLFQTLKEMSKKKDAGKKESKKVDGPSGGEEPADDSTDSSSEAENDVSISELDLDQSAEDEDCSLE